MPGRGNKAHQKQRQQQKQKQKQEQWRFSPLAFKELVSPMSEQPVRITRRRYPTPPRPSIFQEAAQDIPRMPPFPPPSIENT